MNSKLSLLQKKRVFIDSLFSFKLYYSAYSLVDRKAKVSGTETLVYNYNDFNNLLNIYKNGNIKSKWTYDSNGNQLTETTNHEKDEVPGKDAAQVTKEFIYDRSDRLYKLKTTDGTNLQEVTNYYNANGERTKQIEVNKKVTDTNTSVPGLETRYFYNNGKLLFTTDQNHTLVEDNLLDPSGQIIFTKRNDGNYTNKYFFYSHDTRGSVSNIINPDGKLVKGYSYDEFGDTEERGDKTFKNSVQFTGAVNDSSTGLYYMNARFYNPSTARFLTQDSYTGNPYEPRTQHLYSYCANDPINYTDPTGHMMRRDAEDGGSTGGSAEPDPLQTYLNNRVKLGGANKKSVSYINAMTLSGEIKLGTSKALPFIPILNSVNDAKIAFTGLDLYNYAKDESEIQDAKLFTFMNLASLGIASSIGSGAREGKSVAEVVGEGEKKITSMSNEELVQEIATRAEKHVGGIGSVAGTQKHTYSKRLLDRYQRMFGDRGLRTETSWVNGETKPYGTKGSARIDVLDTINNTAYDYKFSIKQGKGLSQRQIDKIFNNGPIYLQYVKEVNP